MTAAADYLKEKLGALSPRYGIVLGSGLGALVEAAAEPLRIPYADIPDFPVSSVSGHAGELVVGKLGDVPVAMLSGRVHYYERGDAGAMRLPIETLKRIGVENLILTNSAGSLREDMPPGSVMRIADHIAFSGSNPLIGVESDSRFVGMTNAYDAALSERMEEAADRLSIPLWRGVYMWFSGPSFETPAEIRMARIMGADAVGMSTVPEVILARFFGLRVAAASVITNFGAGMTGTELSHEETKEMAPLGGERLSALLREMIASKG
ncbi:purine-nucleoside phosphorylase [Sinorhizobium alkalisoli]|uniref:purine-nucleoside phosphorylase n=1 Tax=Sinorhizobium alkalisoli TaxID=1752398 RepID=UPI00124DADE4|nr:purine-nucleoside phosphorylase [Sinorhizobium alkalisoli]MCA1490030.1 purine-nucleoside phosphorylase [Ensifer sp. NBAIM29]MCG5480540.1 purine-nucleoside phosphorylase [Sinorhizobium alkalisoli]QFI68227.1 Purine nucleoside phosphorylase [Sinorhizobium alkalisoli]